MELARLPFPVRADGVVTDGAWDRSEPPPLTLHAPRSGVGRPERTEIRVACDDYLYASGRFFDSRPGEIRMNSLYPDRWSGDDTFARRTGDGRLGVNLRIRYNFSEGSDLWLVYDEGLNTRTGGVPG